LSPGISFHRLARLELLDAVDFYEEEDPGLGRAFLAIFEAGLQRIELNPETAAVVRGSARSLHLRRFPYSIVYRPTDSGPRILAVMNQRRRPFYWRDRS